MYFYIIKFNSTSLSFLFNFLPKKTFFYKNALNTYYFRGFNLPSLVYNLIPLKMTALNVKFACR